MNKAILMLLTVLIFGCKKDFDPVEGKKTGKANSIVRVIITPDSTNTDMCDSFYFSYAITSIDTMEGKGAHNMTFTGKKYIKSKPIEYSFELDSATHWHVLFESMNRCEERAGFAITTYFNNVLQYSWGAHGSIAKSDQYPYYYSLKYSFFQ